jgi:hypothetical protein
MQVLAESFPDHEDFVLPTAFGNALRAFEVYPRVMYGLESIDGWPRILAILPKEYRELVDDAKAQVDWWVNLIVVSVFFLIEFWIVIFVRWKFALGSFYMVLNTVIPIIIFIVVIRFLIGRATSSAVDWGGYVKSTFDIYRFELAESLGVDSPKNRNAELELWKDFSQAILFRVPHKLPKLKAARVHKKTKPKTKK